MQRDVFLKLCYLQQVGLAVKEYTVEFELLMLKWELAEPEENTIAKYMEGLKTSINNVV